MLPRTTKLVVFGRARGRLTAGIINVILLRMHSLSVSLSRRVFIPCRTCSTQALRLNYRKRGWLFSPSASLVNRCFAPFGEYLGLAPAP